MVAPVLIRFVALPPTTAAPVWRERIATGKAALFIATGLVPTLALKVCAAAVGNEDGTALRSLRRGMFALGEAPDRAFEGTDPPAVALARWRPAPLKDAGRLFGTALVNSV